MSELIQAAAQQGQNVAPVTGPLAQKADWIFGALQKMVENPVMSWEEAAAAAGAVASAMAAKNAWDNISKARGDKNEKKRALLEGAQWREADNSIFAYAEITGKSMDDAVANATSLTNKFVDKSHPSVLAYKVARLLTPEELEKQAERFPEALKALERQLPQDAGVARNHLRLAQLGKTPVDRAANAERAAYGAIIRGEAMTAASRKACFEVLNTGAARFVRDETARVITPVNRVSQGEER